jgi:thiamine kinase-like enzyme
MTAEPAMPASPRSAQPPPRDVATLRAALARLPEFGADGWSATPVTGGLTNRIYRIDTQGHSAVARLSVGKSDLLAIDREAECFNSRAAADAGAGPRVLLCDPDALVSVVQWIPGRTWSEAELDDPDNLTEVAALCRTLHGGPRFVNDFDMFAVQRGYREVVHARGFRIPERYDEFAAQVSVIESAMRAGDDGTVPCHNDLLAANMIHDGERLWFIDYEYAGNNDPCFELGNIWSEAGLEPDRLEHLVAAYYGRRRPDKVARARLFGLMAKYGWTLWASISASVSDVDFDFWSWGMEKYERAVAEFDGPGFAQLIDDVQQPT